MQVYADNAATTRMSQVAIDAMIPCFREVYGNPSSLHSVGQQAKEVLEDCRARVAAAIGCEPREIYFTSGGSEADNHAILSAKTAPVRARSTSSPPLLSIMQCCTCCRNWRARASKSPIWT